MTVIFNRFEPADANYRQSTLDKLNQLLDDVRNPNDATVTAAGSTTARSLAERLAQERDVRDFGGVVGADVSAPLQAAINSLGAVGGRVILRGGRYLQGTVVTLPTAINGVTIESVDGATLVSTLPVNSVTTYVPLLQLQGTTIRSNITPTADLAAGAQVVSLSPADVAGVQVGDHCTITTTAAITGGSSACKAGAYRRVRLVGASSVTLDGPVPQALSVATDTVRVQFVRPLRNVALRGLGFELVSGGGQTGAWVRGVDGFLAQDCYFNGQGGESFVGLCVEGINVKVERARAEHFQDSTLHLGYGVQVSGHDIVVRDCSLSDCKHGLTGAQNSYYSSGIVFTNNHARDALLDMHGNAEDVLIQGNRIEEVGAYNNGSYASGIWVRGKRMRVLDNTIVGSSVPTRATDGIRIYDSVTGEIQVRGNVIRDVTTGIQVPSGTPALTSLRIEANSVQATGYGIILRDVSNTQVRGNQVDTGEHGIYLLGGDRVHVQGNIVEYSRTIFGGGIFAEDFSATRICKGLIIDGNTCRRMSSAGTNPIRVKRGYNYVAILGNVTDVNGLGGTHVQTTEDTDMTVSAVANNVAIP